MALSSLKKGEFLPSFLYGYQKVTLPYVPTDLSPQDQVKAMRQTSCVVISLFHAKGQEGIIFVQPCFYLFVLPDSSVF